MINFIDKNIVKKIEFGNSQQINLRFDNSYASDPLSKKSTFFKDVEDESENENDDDLLDRISFILVLSLFL